MRVLCWERCVFVCLGGGGRGLKFKRELDMGHEDMMTLFSPSTLDPLCGRRPSPRRGQLCVCGILWTGPEARTLLPRAQPSKKDRRRPVSPLYSSYVDKEGRRVRLVVSLVYFLSYLRELCSAICLCGYQEINSHLWWPMTLSYTLLTDVAHACSTISPVYFNFILTF